MSVNLSVWHDVWLEWKKTSNDIYLEYLTCCEDSEIIINFLKLIMEENLTPWRVEQNNTHYNIVLLIIAKHAQNHVVCTFIFENFKLITITPIFKK